jgi:uncharacterized membrane protein
MEESKKKWLKIFFCCIWVLFLPNSIYLLADITHLFEQWNMVDVPGKIILLIEYSIILMTGVLTYIYSMYPFEKLINRSKQLHRKTILMLIIVDLNFLVGIAIVLGRIHRINSWDVVTNFSAVVNATLKLFASSELVTIALLLGLFANLLYFLLRKQVIKYTNILLKTK